MGDSSAVPIYTETGISRELDRNSGACELVSLAKVREDDACAQPTSLREARQLSRRARATIAAASARYYLSGTSLVSSKTSSSGCEFDRQANCVVQHQRSSSCHSHKQAGYRLCDISRAIDTVCRRPRASATMNACTSSTWTFVLSPITLTVQA